MTGSGIPPVIDIEREAVRHIDDLTQADPPQARGRAIPPARPGPRGVVIARTIVEAHGGRLWAGAAARGASVRFYLPATARTGA